MSAADSGSKKYRVEASSFIKSEIASLAQRAAAMGQLKAYCDAWLEIEKKLARDPLSFGECRYHLAKGDLRCHIGAIRPVAVEFGIYQAKNGVILMKVFLLGFDEGEPHDSSPSVPS